MRVRRESESESESERSGHVCCIYKRHSNGGPPAEDSDGNSFEGCELTCGTRCA